MVDSDRKQKMKQGVKGFFSSPLKDSSEPSTDVRSSTPEVRSSESEPHGQRSEVRGKRTEAQTQRVVPQAPRTEIDMGLINELINEVTKTKKGRVSFWSVQTALVLAYLSATRPSREFTMSNEIKEILEPGLKKKYPDLWRAAEEALTKSK